jgi:uncharacterized protein (DUF2267 family)
MDPISTALTVAWLDAVRRAQSADLQRYLQQTPQAAPARDERTLTDVIERVIESGGASPDQAPAQQASSPYLVDRLV